jgi:hypothetical protein
MQNVSTSTDRISATTPGRLFVEIVAHVFVTGKTRSIKHLMQGFDSW